MKKLIPIIWFLFGIGIIALGTRAILVDDDIGRNVQLGSIGTRWQRSLMSLLLVGSGVASIYYAWLCQKQNNSDDERRDEP